MECCGPGYASPQDAVKAPRGFNRILRTGVTRTATFHFKTPSGPNMSFAYYAPCHQITFYLLFLCLVSSNSGQ